MLSRIEEFVRRSVCDGREIGVASSTMRAYLAHFSQRDSFLANFSFAAATYNTICICERYMSQYEF